MIGKLVEVLWLGRTGVTPPNLPPPCPFNNCGDVIASPQLLADLARSWAASYILYPLKKWGKGVTAHSGSIRAVLSS